MHSGRKSEIPADGRGARLRAVVRQPADYGVAEGLPVRSTQTGGGATLLQRTVSPDFSYRGF